ncbi:HAD hydrolase-like protein [Maricaulis sp.]|uniref:HAD hydrolase-like protein n=1 Tax=Maricaulis sp. TaxID=1486257 RepID=UPI002620DCBE|nr:HAD hydrolase-like protein [Maricaulis sp.]
MRRYDLVIFDFDGTLADSLTWFRTALADVIDRHGLTPLCEERAEALRGMRPKEIMTELGIPAWKLPFIAADVRARAAENVDKIHLFDGIADALQELHAKGTQLALVSSNGETAVREVLGPELSGLFSQFSCGAALFGKASVFRKVMRKARVAPERTLSVGDETRDIEAAREAGCACAAVSWGFATRDALEREGADVLLDATPRIAALAQANAALAQRA